MKLHYATLLAGGLLASGGFASAAAAQCQRPTAAEIEAERTALFAAADADGNQALSQEEFSSFTELQREAHLARLFTCLDANNDGRVSVEELATFPPGGPPPGGPF